jgi:arabinose-5-phosphate isomerase
VIALTAHADSPLAKVAQVAVTYGPVTEAGPTAGAPTTSALVALALGDALATALAAARGFEARDFAFLHPGGVLGGTRSSPSRTSCTTATRCRSSRARTGCAPRCS